MLSKSVTRQEFRQLTNLDSDPRLSAQLVHHKSGAIVNYVFVDDLIPQREQDQIDTLEGWYALGEEGPESE